MIQRIFLVEAAAAVWRRDWEITMHVAIICFMQRGDNSLEAGLEIRPVTGKLGYRDYNYDWFA